MNGKSILYSCYKFEPIFCDHRIWVLNADRTWFWTWSANSNSSNSCTLLLYRIITQTGVVLNCNVSQTRGKKIPSLCGILLSIGYVETYFNLVLSCEISLTLVLRSLCKSLSNKNILNICNWILNFELLSLS